LLAVAFIVLSPYFISAPIEQTLNVDFSKVDKIDIGVGLQGKTCTLTDKSSIDDIIKRLDGVRLRKNFDQSRINAQVLSVSLYESGRKVSEFIYTDEILTVYNISNDNYVRYEASMGLAEADTDEILYEYNMEGKPT
jgi:hypothetical protein